MSDQKHAWTPIPAEQMVSSLSELPPMTDDEIALAVRIIELIRKEAATKAAATSQDS